MHYLLDPSSIHIHHLQADTLPLSKTNPTNHTSIMSNFLSEAEQVGQDFSNNSGNSSGDSGLAQTAEKDLSQQGNTSSDNSSSNSSGGGVEDSFVNNGMSRFLHNYKRSKLISS